MAKKLAVIVGIILILVGILGFIPNQLIGSTGYFGTSSTLNIAYIIFGIILLIAGMMSASSASMWLKIIGIVYIILFLDGLFQANSLLGFIGANGNDIWLHLVLGIVILVIGFSAKGSSMPMMDRGTM